MDKFINIIDEESYQIALEGDDSLLTVMAIQDIVEEKIYEMVGGRKLSHWLQLPRPVIDTSVKQLAAVAERMWNRPAFRKAISQVIEGILAGGESCPDFYGDYEEELISIHGQIRHFMEAHHVSDNLCLFVPRIALPSFFVEREEVELSVNISTGVIPSLLSSEDDESESEEAPAIVVDMKTLEESRPPPNISVRRKERKNKKPKNSNYRPVVNHIPYWFSENERRVAENLKNQDQYSKDLYNRYSKSAINYAQLSKLYLDINDTGLEKDDILQMFERMQNNDRGHRIHTTFKRGINNDHPSEVYSYNCGRDFHITPEVINETKNDVSTLISIFSMYVVQTGRYTTAYTKLLKFIRSHDVDLTASYFVLHNINEAGYADVDHTLFRSIYRGAAREVPLKDITKLIDMRNVLTTKFNGADYPYAQVRQEPIIDDMLLLDSHEVNIQNELRALCQMKRLPKNVPLTHLIARKEYLSTCYIATADAPSSSSDSGASSSSADTIYQDPLLPEIPVRTAEMSWFEKITTLPERVYNKLIASFSDIGTKLGFAMMRGALEAVQAFLIGIKEYIIQILHMAWRYIKPCVDALKSGLKKLGVFAVNMKDEYEAHLMVAILMLCVYLCDKPLVRACLIGVILYATNTWTIVKDVITTWYADDATLEEHEYQATSCGEILACLTGDWSIVLTTIICALLVGVCGVSAKAISRGDIAQMCTNSFRNVSFVGMGLAAIPKIYQCISTALTSIVNYVKKKFGCEIPDDSRQRNIERAVAFAIYVNSIDDELSLRTVRTDKAVQEEIIGMRKTWIWLQAYVVSDEFRAREINPNVAITLRSAITNYKKLLNYVTRLSSQAGFRYTTFHLQLVGEAGVGKSTLISKIVSDIQKKYYPEIDPKDLTWARTDKEYFDGYCNQRITLADDMWTINDAKMYAESIHLINNTPTPLPMAALEDKHIFFNSDFMISTVNNAYPDIKDVLCKTAVERRRHLLVRVKCDPECMGPDNKFSIALANEKYNLGGTSTNGVVNYDKEKVNKVEWLTFDIQNPIGRAGTDNVYYEPAELPSGLKIPLKDLTYSKMITRLYSRYDTMRQEEKHSLNIPPARQQELNEGLLAITKLLKNSGGRMPLLEEIDLGTFAMPRFEEDVPTTSGGLLPAVQEVIGVVAEPTADNIERDPVTMEPLQPLDAPPPYDDDIMTNPDAFTNNLVEDDGETPTPFAQFVQNRCSTTENVANNIQTLYDNLRMRAKLFGGMRVMEEMIVPAEFELNRFPDLRGRSRPFYVPDAGLNVRPDLRSAVGMTEDISGLSAYFMFCMTEDGRAFMARDYLQTFYDKHAGQSAEVLLSYSEIYKQFQLIQHLTIEQRALLARLARVQYPRIYDRSNLMRKMVCKAKNLGLQMVDFVIRGFSFFLNNIVACTFAILVGLYLCMAILFITWAIVELFREVTPTSRVYFKQPKSHIVVTSAPVVQVSDQKAIEAKNLVARNLVRIDIPGLGARNGIAVEGQCIITAAHGLEVLLTSSDFRVNLQLGRDLKNPIAAIVKSSNCYQYKQTDLLIMYSPQFPMFSSIRKHFYTAQKLKEIRPSDVWLKYIADDGHYTEKFVIKDLVDCFNYQTRYSETSQHTLLYAGNPGIGSSGGALLAPTNHGMGSILGIQCARKSGTGIGCIVTQEVLNELFKYYGDKHIIAIPPVKTVCEVTSTTANLFDENVRLIAQVSSNEVLGVVGDTQYRKTMMFGEFTSDREPAVLNAFDKRVAPGTHPMQHSINKYARHCMEPLPSKVLRRATRDIYGTLRAHLPRPPKFMTIEEVVQGNPDHSGVNLKTSPGIPWVYKTRTAPGKQAWIRKDLLGQVTVEPEIRAAIELARSNLREGVIPPTLMYEFPKDELRPAEKVLRARSISVNDMALSILGNQYILDLTNMIHDLARKGVIPFTVGIDPNSITWLKMYNRMRRYENRCSDADINNWDGHATPQLINAAMKILIKLMRLNKEFDRKDEVLLRGLTLQMVFAYVQILDVVIHTMRGMKSGWFKTAEINTLAHWLLFLTIYYMVTADTKFCLYTAFLQYVVLYVYGDDIMFALSPDLPLTPSDIYNQYIKYGWPVSAADKISSFTEFKNVHNVQFLKRRFVPDYRLGDQWVHAQIEESVIYDLICWQRTQANDVEQLYTNLNEACCFMFPYGAAKYSEFVDRVNKVLKLHYYGIITLPYRDIRSILYRRYLDVE